MGALPQFISWLTDLAAGQWLTHLVPRAQRWKEIQGGWAESSSEASGPVAWGLGIVVVAGGLYVILQSQREKKKRRERELLYFDRKAVDKDLDRKHIDLLMSIVKQVTISSPYRVLESYDVFQHLVEAYHQKQKFSKHEHKFFHQQVDEIKEELGYNKIEETVQLQNTQEIRKGQEVKIIIDRDSQSYEYRSELLFNTDERLTFSAADIDLSFIKPAGGKPITVQFYRDNDAGYSFLTTPSQPPDQEKKELYLKHPTKLERKQARSFSRMEVHFSFSFFHLAKDKFNTIEVDMNLDKCESLPVFIAETVDISGGGLAFYTRHGVKKGDFLYLNFQQLSEEHRDPVLCEVVYHGLDQERECDIVRASFHNINDLAQDTIMRFVYQMQRKAARRLKFAPKK